MSAENVSRARTWKRLAWPLLLTAVVQAALIQAPRAGEDSGSRPRVDADGVAHVPAMSVPPSRFMSPEARSKFIKLFSNPEPSPPAGADIRLVREHDERKNPAASEDVASVYRELLKEHRAADIGIYGCSAGGMLPAEAVAWFQQEKLPQPGAIGTFCGSAGSLGGDSSHLASLLVGESPSAAADTGSLSLMPYFSEASSSDPLVLPISSQRVLSRFPPTLLIAGSRDFTVSSLFHAQAALTSVGVEAELHVWDGMWHAFFMDPDLPESQQVYRVVAKFFDRHLGALQH